MSKLVYIATTLGALTFVSNAWAVDFSQPLKGLDGQPILAGAEKEPILLSTVVANLLLADEKGLGGIEKMTRFELATKIFKGGDVDLTEAETAKIKTLAETNLSPLLYSRVVQALKVEPSDTPPAEEKK